MNFFKSYIWLIILIFPFQTALCQKAGSIDHSFNVSDTISTYGIGANGPVHVVKTLSDGKILIAGGFSQYNGEIGNFFRLHPDGSVDVSFTPVDFGINTSTFSKIIIQPDNKIIVAGLFSQQKEIVRLNSDGTLDNTFNVGNGPNGLVKDAVLQPNGKIVILGEFVNYNLIPAYNLCRINFDGSFDNTFTSPISQPPGQQLLSHLALQADGKIILLGSFGLADGFPSSKICRINPDGSFDSGYSVGVGFDGQAIIHCAQIIANDFLLVSGSFSSFDGAPARAMLKINPNGLIDNTFNHSFGAGSFINSFASNGTKIFAQGHFSNSGVYNGAKMVCLNLSGSIDNSFAPGQVHSIKSIGFTNDGIVLGGSFSEYDYSYFSSIVKIKFNGIPDFTFNRLTGFDNDVEVIKVQLDGKIIVAGQFRRYNDTFTKCIIRLEPNGEVDTTFSGNYLSTFAIKSLALQADGKILVGGNNLSYGSLSGNLLRLFPNGMPDTTFNPQIPYAVSKVFVQSNQRIFAVDVGGDLHVLNQDGSVDNGFIQNVPSPIINLNDVFNIGELSSGGLIICGFNRVTKLNPDGTSPQFPIFPPLNGNVYGFVEVFDPESNIIVYGDFQSAQTSLENFVKLSGSTGAILSYHYMGGGSANYNINGHIIDAVYQPLCDKVIFIGGFQTLSGQNAMGIGRIYTDASPDMSFDIGYGFSNAAGLSKAKTIALQGPDKLLVGGLFNSFDNGILKNKMFRMNVREEAFWYFDNDNDGYYGDSTLSCYSPGPGWQRSMDKSFLPGFDCDDEDPLINPGAFDIYPNSIDENCDGVDGFLSNEELSQSTIFRVYPNPSNGVWNLFSGVEAQLIVLDLTGKIVFTANIQKGNTVIDLKDKPIGIYFLKVQSGLGILFSEKLILSN